MPVGYGREISNTTKGFSRFFVSSQKDFLSIVNRSNGHLDCYSTEYAIPERRAYSGAVVDRIYLDIDDQYCSDKFVELKKLYDFCKAYSVKRLFSLSGNGYHARLFCTPPNNVKSPKLALTKATKKIIEKLDLHVDMHPVGDVARPVRILWTENIKAKKICQPITSLDIKKGEQHLNEISKDRGMRPLKIEGFRKIPLDMFKEDTIPKARKTGIAASIFGIDKTDLLPCVRPALELPNPTHYGRFILVTHLADLAALGNVESLSDDEKAVISDEIFNFIEQNTSWDDWKPSYTRYQVEQIVFKGYTPKCEWIKTHELCPKGAC